jgi:hypothetical protein
MLSSSLKNGTMTDSSGKLDGTRYFLQGPRSFGFVARDFEAPRDQCSNDSPLAPVQKVTFVVNVPKNQGLTGLTADPASSPAAEMLP